MLLQVNPTFLRNLARKEMDNHKVEVRLICLFVYYKKKYIYEYTHRLGKVLLRSNGRYRGKRAP